MSQRQRPSDSEVCAQLARILKTRSFANSSRASELLQTLVERCLQEDVDPPKETVLGVEVFGRTPGYDTLADPVVRVTASRLRSKLKQFYRSAGKEDTVRIEMPLGGYALEFSYCDASQGQEGAAAAPGLIETATARPLIGPGRALFHHFHAPRRGAESAASYAGLDAPARPVFSSDGRAIAFDWKGPGDQVAGIYVQRLDADAPARFSRSAAREVRPAWSPDGGKIAFLREIGEGRFEIRTAPVFGLGERLLAEITTRPGDVPGLEWSRDGKALVTSGKVYEESESVLLVLLVEGGIRQQITAPEFGCWGDDEAVFSPAGDMLAFRRRQDECKGDVYLHPMTSGTGERRLTWEECEIFGIAWSGGGDNLVVSLRRNGDSPGLWRIGLTDSPPVRLTDASESNTWPAATRRGDKIAYVRESLDLDPVEQRAWDSQIMIVEDLG